MNVVESLWESTMLLVLEKYTTSLSTLLEINIVFLRLVSKNVYVLSFGYNYIAFGNFVPNINVLKSLSPSTEPNCICAWHKNHALSTI